MTQENSSGTQVVSTQSTKMPAQAKKIDVLKTMLNAPSVMDNLKMRFLRMLPHLLLPLLIYTTRIQIYNYASRKRL